MGRNSINKTEYINKLSKRLSDLSADYIKSKETYRKEQNLQIAARNKEAKKKWKATLRPTSNCPQEDLLPKYTIAKFCDEISQTYNVDFQYKHYNLYTTGAAFPDDPKIIQAFAKTFGVSFEYMYGLSDIENEVTASLEQLLPINSNAINTLRNLSGNEEAIKILNAILTNTEECSSELINMYEEQYHIFKSKALGKAYDYDTMQRRIISAELFANYIETNLLSTEQPGFEKRLNNELEEMKYRAEHFVEYKQEAVDDINSYYDSEYGTPKISVTLKNIEDGQ